MSLFRRLFYRCPPDGVVEISPNILVFDHCFSMDYVEQDEMKPHIGGILKQLLGRYSIDSFMVFNFDGSKKDSQTARIFSEFNMGVMGYPSNYEGCPLLTMEMIHHFLRSGESWLSLASDNLLLIHSEQGGWPTLAFALAALLVYLRRYTDERKALGMIHKQAPPELVEIYSPLDPAPSQLRYLKYVSRRHISPKLWPPDDKILNLNCAIIRKVPNFDGQGGCRPVFRIYGTDPLTHNDDTAKVLFSTPKTSDFVQLHTQEDNEIIKANVRCPVQGDVVMECISLDEDFGHEVMMFRVMFSTAFIVDNMLLLNRDQIDILWDTKHRFPVDFRVEVIFSEMDATTSKQASESSSEKEIFYNVDVASSQLESPSKTDHMTIAASEQKGLNIAHAGFEGEKESASKFEGDKDSAVDAFSVPEAFATAEVSLAEGFEGARDVTADAFSLPDAETFKPNGQERELLSDALSLPDAETFKPNGQEHELLNDALSNPDTETFTPNGQEHEVLNGASAGEKAEGDPAKIIPDSVMPLVNNLDPEPAAATELSDTNTDSPSDTPSSSVPPSPPKFDDEDTMDAETAEAKTEPQ